MDLFLKDGMQDPPNELRLLKEVYNSGSLEDNTEVVRARFSKSEYCSLLNTRILDKIKCSI